MAAQADDEVQPVTPPTTPANRARALVALMTLDEKLALLHQVSPGIERLGLAPFRTGTEALHGVSWLGTATVFPQPVGLAATWDAELLERVGDAVATEVRAKHAADPTVSLNVWAPVVNPLRHPLWGRNEEGFSEDPCLTAHLAGAYALGLRGRHPDVWKTVPTLKHFLAYSNEADRSVTSSQMRPRVLHEYELPAFRGPVEAGVVGAVMPSYNLVNGRPNHVAKELLDELRSWTDESLLVVSDAAAPTNLVESERYYDSHVTSHAASLLAGVDSFTDNDTDSGPTIERVRTALEQGLVTERDIDTAVQRLLHVRALTGELDRDNDPYASIPATSLDLPEHRALAREATARGVVVLTNDGILPLVGDDGQSPASVAVVGPLAERVLHDWYSGTPPYLHGLGSALDARLAGTEVTVVDGADRVALRSSSTGRYLRVSQGDGTMTADSPVPDESACFDLTDWGDGVVTLRHVLTGALVSGRSWIVRADAERVGGWVAQETFRLHRHDDATWSVKHIGSGRWLRVQAGSGTLVAEAETAQDAERFDLKTVVSGEVAVAEAAAAAQAVVVAVGNDPHILGRETEDRPGLALPARAQALWRAAREANDRAVLAVVSSYPYALGEIAETAAAVVWSSHAGQELGPGLTDVLVGDEEPYGRLAQTWTAEDAHLADILDYDIIASRSTYWYSPHEPLFAFGHGLTYSTVEYVGARLADDGRAVTVDVSNTGARTAHELVQVYSAAPEHRLPVPRVRLAGHERVTLAPGERRSVEVSVDEAALAVWDVRTHTLRVEPGEYELRVGPSSGDLPLMVRRTVAGTPVGATAVLGTTVRAADFDAARGLVLAERTRERGDAMEVAAGRSAGWLELRDLDLSGVGALALTVARRGPGRATVTVSSDVLASGRHPEVCQVPPTDGPYDWQTVTVPLTADPGAAGLLRITLGGPARLAEIVFG
ncbi:glycoside hydrolase family 3 N-terminal domain-containing protein [Sanguibacter sp. 25GB23B1]|uniref:glycoside hydrolase family 3 N-terminal domain-containing protein n=1 Tax=unclassified Sanguibacter TaxID=2645534 RepID=UPI0032AF20A8